jgi:hypothetical protein
VPFQRLGLSRNPADEFTKSIAMDHFHLKLMVHLLVNFSIKVIFPILFEKFPFAMAL